MYIGDKRTTTRNPTRPRIFKRTTETICLCLNNTQTSCRSVTSWLKCRAGGNLIVRNVCFDIDHQLGVMWSVVGPMKSTAFEPSLEVSFQKKKKSAATINRQYVLSWCRLSNRCKVLTRMRQMQQKPCTNQRPLLGTHYSYSVHVSCGHPLYFHSTLTSAPSVVSLIL